MTQPLDSRYFPLVLDVLDQGVFTVDQTTCITSFNKAAERITGYRCAEVVGRKCSEVFQSSLCDQVCPLRLSIQSREAVRNRQVHIRTREGRPLPISVSTAPLVTARGRLLGGVEVFRDMSQIVDYQRRLGTRYRLVDIIGKSPAMQKIFELLPLVAQSDSTLVVTGASGTGKELVARTVHSLSPRRKGPFVAINCAAVPETLIESELFGYAKGAFTDARSNRPGRIAIAEGGTLFLDEIGDLPRSMQVKVLRFLQDRRYEPLGSSKTLRADVRVIAATNQDLLPMVRRHEFREDLYFRLNVVQIDIPPLSQRPEDVPLLIDHYVKVFRDCTGKPIDGLSDEAMAYLISYPFPGNVRELENLIERAFILCQSSRIGIEHVLPATANLSPGAHLPEPYLNTGALQAAAVRTALARNEGNQTRAAADLGIHRTTLIRRMKRWGVDSRRVT
ncbi:MAG: sigma 54-interacting transcriptional regulator [Deltaproteobacteria bacterium]|nr:sigma 54-interacting transcriptional regulator [Deltaproteobacteria bacterium]